MVYTATDTTGDTQELKRRQKRVIPPPPPGRGTAAGISQELWCRGPPLHQCQ